MAPLAQSDSGFERTITQGLKIFEVKGTCFYKRPPGPQFQFLGWRSSVLNFCQRAKYIDANEFKYVFKYISHNLHMITDSFVFDRGI